MNDSLVLVADVMTIDPVVVRVDATIDEAVALLRAYSISGLPVVDGRGDLVGVISQTDVVALTEPSVGRLIRRQGIGVRVGDVMTSPAVTVPMTARLAEAARVMVDSHVHRLVALDDEGAPVGVLSSTDFVALFAAG